MLRNAKLPEAMIVGLWENWPYLRIRNQRFFGFCVSLSIKMPESKKQISDVNAFNRQRKKWHVIVQLFGVRNGVKCSQQKLYNPQMGSYCMQRAVTKIFAVKRIFKRLLFFLRCLKVFMLHVKTAGPQISPWATLEKKFIFEKKDEFCEVTFF